MDSRPTKIDGRKCFARLNPGSCWLPVLRMSVQGAHHWSHRLSEAFDHLDPVIERLTEAMTPMMRALDGHPQDWKPAAPWIQPSEAFSSVYFGWPGVHIVNTRSSIVLQLRRCLQHYHAKVKGQLFASGRPT